MVVVARGGGAVSAPIDTDAIRECYAHQGGPARRFDLFAALNEIDRLRDLLAKALPWIDPNDRHEDYLFTVAIREALGEMP